MKANEFVRDKGVKAAKLIIDCWINYPETDVYLPDMMEYTFIAIEPTENCPFVSLSDLKRIVESHELVESLVHIYKDIEVVRERASYCGCLECKNRLQAIADVESCL